MENEKLPLPPNRVADDYRDKTVLVTGGTGLMGKIIVEKLLRTCPDIKRLYLLIRSKRDKGSQTRLLEMFKDPLYKLLKTTQGEDVIKKVVAIPGDVSKPDLGLSNENRLLLMEEVQIIFHLAATVRFDQSLTTTVLHNTRGTKLMLELAKGCSKLEVFVYSSTAYCHLHERVLYEKTYPPPVNPHAVITLCELLNEDIVNLFADKLIGDSPNMYVFSKALSEGIVSEQIDNLPIVIVRPSIVIPVWKEPIPGWTNNLNGPVGLLIAAGKGVLRSMFCNPNAYADFIPVDVAANGIILVIHDFMNHKVRRIFNLTTSFENKVSWKEMIDTARKIIETRMPLGGAVWYPGGSLKSNRLLHNICVVLFHYIPALIIDAILFISGNKPVLWGIQRRIADGSKMLEYFACNQWDFNTDVCLEGKALLNDTERNMYQVDGTGFHLEEYFYHCIHATRLYILKQSDDTIASDKQHMKMLWVVDKFARLVLFLVFLYLMYQLIISPILSLF